MKNIKLWKVPLIVLGFHTVVVLCVFGIKDIHETYFDKKEPRISYGPVTLEYEKLEKVKPSHEITNLLITVHWQENVDMIRVLADDDNVVGLSTCLAQPEDNMAWCDIYVVRPEHVYGDPHMDTLGHEVLHGLLGTFHEE